MWKYYGYNYVWLQLCAKLSLTIDNRHGHTQSKGTDLRKVITVSLSSPIYEGDIVDMKG